jgi:hypothetical protein
MKAFLISILLFISLLAGSIPAPVAYWKLNELSGNGSDEIGDNDYVFTGTLATTGKIGNCRLFDANGSYGVTNDVPALQLTDNFSMGGWVNVSGYKSTFGTVFGGESGAASLNIRSSGALQFTIVNISESPESSGTVSLNIWTHIFLTFNTTTNNGEYFINGQSAGTFTQTSNVSSEASTNLIGIYINGASAREFSGLIDEIGIWNVVLSQQQIDSLYNSGNGCTYQFNCWSATQNYPSGVVARHGGKLIYPQHNSKIIAGIKSIHAEDIPGDDFLIYQSWDFENSTGDWTPDSVHKHFDVFLDYGSGGTANITGKTRIVTDTINGVATKVLECTNPADALAAGPQWYVEFDKVNEVYLSYNIKFDDGFNSTAGGKLPGLRGLPPGDYSNCPDSPDDGFYAAPMFKYANSMISYHYDRTSSANRVSMGASSGTTCPWAIETYLYNSIWMANKTWYNITHRLVDNDPASSNGIEEIWIDGKLVFRGGLYKHTEHDTMGINGFFMGSYYGGNNEGYQPTSESKVFYDNIYLWTPTNDSISGHNLHHVSTVMPTPAEITDRDFGYDQLVTSGSFSITGIAYGDGCQDKTVLIDVGAGNIASVNITAGGIGGSGDMVFFYDGKDTDASLIQRLSTYSTDISGVRTATGRYMFIRVSVNRDGGLYNITGEVVSEIAFNVIESWDFESETVGTYTEAEIAEDFNPQTLRNHNCTEIAVDSINGVATKVLKVNEYANVLNWGFECTHLLDQGYDELYFSYNVQFSPNFNSTSGGKLPGFFGGDVTFTALNCPDEETEGPVCKIHFKKGGLFYTYHYDFTGAPYNSNYPTTCPYSIEGYTDGEVYFIPGNWYNVTQRIVRNTFTEGDANSDGIHEVWVDGELIYQKNQHKFVVDSSMRINGLFFAFWYGGSGASYTPLSDCYYLMDNAVAWLPTNDSVSGSELHHAAGVLPHPDPITNKDIVYDHLITSGNFQSTNYGSVGACTNEIWLIDAGVGNIASVNITAGGVGGGDYLFFYDGKTTDSDIIELIQTYDTSITGVRTASGRYMTILYITDRDGGFTGIQGTKL